MEDYGQQGFLNSNFRIFHLTDKKLREFKFHYHAFHKILILLKGKVTYHIDGKAYRLEPYDIVLVHEGEIHRPQIEEGCEYERIIIYISDEFIRSYNSENYSLCDCFTKAKETGSSVLRVKSLATSSLYKTIIELEDISKENENGSDAYANILYEQIKFIEFLIQLNRAVRNEKIAYIATSAPNRKIVEIMEYIEENMTKELTIEKISGKFFIDKYYLMHLFKEEAGCTVGQYITGKRLSKVDELMRQGISISEACYNCGFQNYSTFSRAYKKYFGCSPKDRNRQNIATTYRFSEEEKV